MSAALDMLDCRRDALRGERLDPFDDLIRERMDAWRRFFAIENAQDEHYFRVMISCSIQIETCENDEVSIRNQAAVRAAYCWDVDRAADAAQLGARLSDQPELVALKLQGTAHGCDWLIGRWEGLAALARRGVEWTAEQKALAFDLLGVPKVLRDGSTPWQPDETPSLLAAREIARLKAFRRDGLDEIDEHRHDMTLRGYDPAPNPQVAAVHRYAAALFRRYRWAESKLTPRRKPNPLVDQLLAAAPDEIEGDDPPPPPPVTTPKPIPKLPPNPPPARPGQPLGASVSAYSQTIFDEMTDRHLRGDDLVVTAAVPTPKSQPQPAAPNRRARRAGRKGRRGR